MTVRSAAIKLTIFAIVTSFVTVLLGRTIANTLGGDTVSYAAEFSDITGLLAGDDVRIAGVAVGRVTGTRVVGNHARVTFKLRTGVKLTTSTTARIRYRNLLGQRYVTLAEGDGLGAELRPGDVIPLGQTQPALDLTALFNGFKPIFDTLEPEAVNALATEIVRTLQGEGGTIDSLLASTASLTNTLADRDAAIGRVVRNLDLVARTVAERDATLSEFIKELQRLTTGVAGDRDAIGAALQSIDALARDTAHLVRDARPSLDTSIARLDELVALAADKAPELDAVLQQLPAALEALVRATSYGSWLNLYVLDLKVQVGDTVIPIPPTAIGQALRTGRAADSGERGRP